MSRWLKALNKVGLVELEAGEDGAPPAPLVREAAQITAAVADAPPLSPQESIVAEQQPLSEIYRQQNVPDSPFPAEKLLKLLSGLSAMDTSTQKAAIQAMDAADDTWTIDDAILDAQRKVKALEYAKSHLNQQATSAAVHAQAELAEIDQAQTTNATSIKQQIADLNALLEREAGKAAAKKADVQNQSKAQLDASVRECARLDFEIVRLKQIHTLFSQPAAPAPSKN